MTRDSISSIGATDLQEFEGLLTTFLADTQARCAVLVDRTGRLLTAVGDTGGFDQITFASLAAADFAASDQLAVLLGEQEFSSLYHHGERHSMFLADIGGLAILAALFDRRTTLGMIRVKARVIVPKLRTAMASLAERGATGGAVQMDVGWADDAVMQIDRLFTD